MSLDKEQIIRNTKKYFKTAEEKGFMNESLQEFLGQNFFTAPASTNKDLNNAFEGGLIDHLLRTTKFAIKINGALPEELQSTEAEIIKVCFLYQIGKAHLFTPCTSEWHRKNQGKMYEFNDELISMKIGERSAFYALSHGITLTEIEYQAIVNHDKTDADKQSVFYTSNLGILLRQANEWAIREEKLTATDE